MAANYERALAVVTWHDACIHWGEHETAVHEPSVEMCAGWLVKSDEKGITLAYSYTQGEDGDRDQYFIPRSLVVKEEIIRARRRPSPSQA